MRTTPAAMICAMRNRIYVVSPSAKDRRRDRNGHAICDDLGCSSILALANSRANDGCRAQRTLDNLRTPVSMLEPASAFWQWAGGASRMAHGPAVSPPAARGGVPPSSSIGIITMMAMSIEKTTEATHDSIVKAIGSPPSCTSSCSWWRRVRRFRRAARRSRPQPASSLGQSTVASAGREKTT